MRATTPPPLPPRILLLHAPGRHRLPPSLPESSGPRYPPTRRSAARALVGTFPQGPAHHPPPHPARTVRQYGERGTDRRFGTVRRHTHYALGYTAEASSLTLPAPATEARLHSSAFTSVGGRTLRRAECACVLSTTPRGFTLVDGSYHKQRSRRGTRREHIALGYI